MARDNVLFVVIGLLVGFIGGYLMHEVMAARQPVPAWAGGGAAAQVGPEAAGPPAAGRQGAQPGPVPTEEIARLEAYVEQNPDDGQAVLLLANVNFQMQRWERAAGLYTRYLELEPDDPDAMTDLGVCYRELERFDEALASFERAQSLAPEHWQSRYNEVVILAFDLERPAEASEALEELRALEPDNPSVERLVEEIDRLQG